MFHYSSSQKIVGDVLIIENSLYSFSEDIPQAQPDLHSLISSNAPARQRVEKATKD